MSRHISSTRLVRTYNASTVLRTLYEHGSCSRSQLAKLTGMSPATITRIIAELIKQGVVLEGKAGKSTGGRRPVYLHIDHSKLYLASVKLLQDDSQIALLDLKGRILALEHLHPASLAPEEFLTTVITSLLGSFRSLSVKQEHIIGVGVAVSGICQSEEGRVIRSVNLGWTDVPIADILGEGLQLPVFVENDANACALAELWLGNAKDTTNSMYIKTESGAGAGIISNDALLKGPRFVTGEIGHIPLIPNGEPCRCGQRGCLEPYVYFGDVQGRYERATGNRITRSEFIELVQNGEKTSVDIAHETASALALACAHWGVLLDLDIITIGGFWGDFRKDIVEYCQSYYNTILEQSGIPSKTTILGSGFDDDADLLGAAGLVIDHWFTPFSVPFDR